LDSAAEAEFMLVEVVWVSLVVVVVVVVLSLE